MSSKIKGGSRGRVNADANLYAFNTVLKSETVRKRGYWEENKDMHPINRWQYRRWKKDRDETNIFQDKFQELPADYKFRIQKLLSYTNIRFLGPLVFHSNFQLALEQKTVRR